MVTVQRGHLVLVGLMGAGKTTVGRACAARLGRRFVDTDDAVVAIAGIPFDDIWRDGGEPRFRELERKAIEQVVAERDPLVVACGGGAVVDRRNRDALRTVGTVVWLQAPPEVLATRVGDGSGRPLLAHGARSALERLSVEREDAYADAADLCVDTSGRSVDDVVDAVLDAYAGARQ